MNGRVFHFVRGISIVLAVELTTSASAQSLIAPPITADTASSVDQYLVERADDLSADLPTISIDASALPTDPFAIRQSPAVEPNLLAIMSDRSISSPVRWLSMDETTIIEDEDDSPPTTAAAPAAFGVPEPATWAIVITPLALGAAHRPRHRRRRPRPEHAGQRP
jgi:hypothetical protein